MEGKRRSAPLCKPCLPSEVKKLEVLSVRGYQDAPLAHGHCKLEVIVTARWQEPRGRNNGMS